MTTTRVTPWPVAPTRAPRRSSSATSPSDTPGTDAAAIEDLSFTVPAGEVCVLVGPSGCGKTTAMRLVNRMISLTSGDIRSTARASRTARPSDLRREIGYVIQQVGLFPHLTILEQHHDGSAPARVGQEAHGRSQRTSCSI